MADDARIRAVVEANIAAGRERSRSILDRLEAAIREKKAAKLSVPKCCSPSGTAAIFEFTPDKRSGLAVKYLLRLWP